MDKLRKIVSDRRWEHISEPLKVFDGRLKDMILLLSSIISSKKKEDSVSLEARKQYLVMLVSCYETYLRDSFKEVITNNLVDISKIMEIKKLKDVKFSIPEVEYIRSNEINLSELLAEYINFQNFEEIFGIFSSWGFEKELDKILSSKDDIMPLPDEDFMKKAPDAGEFIIEFFKGITIHKSMMDKSYMISKIQLLLDVRHKIVHKNIDVFISQEDILELTLAVYEFVIAVERFTQFLKQIKSP